MYFTKELLFFGFSYGICYIEYHKKSKKNRDYF